MKYCTYYRSKLSMCSLEYHFVICLPRCVITQKLDTKIKFSWPIRHFNQFMSCSVYIIGCSSASLAIIRVRICIDEAWYYVLFDTDHCVKYPNTILHWPFCCLLIHKFEHHTSFCSRYACVPVYMRWIKWHWDTSKQRPFEGTCCNLTKY